MVCSPGTAATSICARLIASAWPTPPAPATSSMPDSSTDCCKVGLCRASSILPVPRPPSTAPRPAPAVASARSKKSNGSWPLSTVIRSPPPPTERCPYTYDNTQHLLTFSASPNADTPPRVLMRNDYSSGLLVKQTFEDGSAYSYSYDSQNAAAIRAAT